MDACFQVSILCVPPLSLVRILLERADLVDQFNRFYFPVCSLYVLDDVCPTCLTEPFWLRPGALQLISTGTGNGVNGYTCGTPSQPITNLLCTGMRPRGPMKSCRSFAVSLSGVDYRADERDA